MSTANKGASTVIAVVVAFAVAGVGGFMLGQVNGRSGAKFEEAAVATVNGQKITKQVVYEKLVKQGGAQLVDRLVDEALVDQALKAANLTFAESEVDAEIKLITERVGGEEQLNAALGQYQITLDQLKDDTRLRLKVAKVLAKDIPTDDASLQKYFDENIAEFDKREVHSRHVLVATEAEAKAIKEQLTQGADFTALAKEKSTDPTAKQNGGDLGFNKRGNMVPEFDKVVFGLKKGDISEPFQSQYGWHVAQVVDIKGTAPDFNAAKNDVKNAYVRVKAAEQAPTWLEQQREKAKIENTLETEKK